MYERIERRKRGSEPRSENEQGPASARALEMDRAGPPPVRNRRVQLSAAVASKPMEESGPTLPNWDSAFEGYLKAAELYGKNRFTTRSLAIAKLGASVSAATVDAESISLYQLLRTASMYGLVDWFGRDEFAIRVLPEADTREWDEAYHERAQTLHTKIDNHMADRRGEAPRTEIETVEYDGRTYLVAYVGAATEPAKITGFVYRAWDPTNHAGVALRAGGRNIPVAKDLAEKLRGGASETFVYAVVHENLHRGDQGLVADIFIDVKFSAKPGSGLH